MSKFFKTIGRLLAIVFMIKAWIRFFERPNPRNFGVALGNTHAI